MVHWDDSTQRDGTGREGGRRVQDVDIWQNQYNIVKLKNKINKIIKNLIKK